MSLEIPNYLKKAIQEGNLHFGDTFQEMIETSINMQMQSLPAENVVALNNIFKKMDARYSAVEESLQVMSSPNKSIKFWDAILESSNLNDQQINSINSIKKLLEADSGSSKKEAIEGDGEDPSVDDQQPTNGQNDSNPDDPEAPANEGDGQDGQDDGMDDGQGDDQAPPMNPEQVLQLELTQTNNKFMSLTLYDKINELLDTIETILETISSSRTEENLDLFESLKMYKNYLNIIAELIFVMDINTVYYNFTNISLEVNDLLDKYLISTKVKTLNDKNSSPQEKEDVLHDLKQNLASKIEANKEIQDEGND